jgi:hypothetical protein
MIPLALVTAVPGIRIRRILQRSGGNFFGGFYLHLRRPIVLLLSHPTLILQNPDQGVVTVQRVDLPVVPKSPD